MRRNSVFKGNAKIWLPVYGVPAVIGIALLIFGSDAAQAFGLLCLMGVVGSFLTISAIELFHDWLDN